MRKIFYLFLTYGLLGSLEAQNRISGPATGLGVIYEISPDGRYVTGLTLPSNGNGFVWDSRSNSAVTVFNKSVYPYYVNNEKWVVGNFNDTINGTPLTSAGYLNPDATAWTSLGSGLLTNPILSTDGSSARRATPTGKIIVGYSQKWTETRQIHVPYCWRKNDAGEWIGEEWAHPANAIQSYIIDIADDGRSAVGFIHNGMDRKAIRWKSPDEYEMSVFPNSYSEYICISANGKYAGFSYDNGVSGSSAGVHNMETDEITLIPESFRINSISNNGLAVGIYRVGNLDRAFAWNPKMGFMDFGDFIAGYAPGLDLTQAIPLQTALKEKSLGFSVNAVTPDGLSFALHLPTGGQTGNVYVLTVAPFIVYPRPENLSATVPAVDRNKVILTWEKPHLESEILTGYAIYRGSTLLTTVDSEALTYTDLNVPNGYFKYSIKGIYDAAYSNASNMAQAMIINNYNLPLRENFDLLNLTSNYWTTEIKGGETRVGWNVYDNTGVGDGNGLLLHVYNFYGFTDQKFSGSLISKYLDAKNADHIYLSFLVKPEYYIEPDLTPDTVFVEVFADNEWKTIDKYVFQLSMEWKADIVDLSEVAAGKLFRVRLRITGENQTVSAKYFHLDDITVAATPPAGNAVPQNLLAANTGARVLLAWKNPHTGWYALTYANSSKRFSIGNVGKNLIAVNRFDAEDLNIYAGKYLTSISAYINQKKTNPTVNTQLKLAVYADEERIVDQAIDHFTPNAWNTFPLDNPLLLAGQNLKFGIEITAHDPAEEPIGVDGTRRPVVGKGDLYSEDYGLTWQTLTQTGLGNNWCITGNVSDNESAETTTSDIIGYNVYSKGKKLNDDLIFGQHFTDAEAGNHYTVRAYSIATGISAESTEKTITGLPVDAKKSALMIYLNPARDRLYIRSEAPVKSIVIYNITGQTIKEQFFESEPNEMVSFPTGILKTGIYIVKIKTGLGEFVQKLQY